MVGTLQLSICNPGLLITQFPEENTFVLSITICTFKSECPPLQPAIKVYGSVLIPVPSLECCSTFSHTVSAKVCAAVCHCLCCSIDACLSAGYRNFDSHSQSVV